MTSFCWLSGHVPKQLYSGFNVASAQKSNGKDMWRKRQRCGTSHWKWMPFYCQVQQFSFPSLWHIRIYWRKGITQKKCTKRGKKNWAADFQKHLLQNLRYEHKVGKWYVLRNVSGCNHYDLLPLQSSGDAIGADFAFLSLGANEEVKSVEPRPGFLQPATIGPITNRQCIFDIFKWDAS